MYLIKRSLDFVFFESIDRRIDTPDSFLRKTGGAPVFTKRANVAVSIFKDDCESFATATNSHDPWSW